MANVNVFNASLEEFETMVNSHPFTFKPRSLTPVPEQYIDFLMADHGPRGLIPIREGESIKDKEADALNAYLLTLKERLRRASMYNTEMTRHGGKPEFFIVEEEAVFKKWHDEIMLILKKQNKLKEIPSFFDGEAAVEVKKEPGFSDIPQPEMIKPKKEKAVKQEVI